MLKFYRILLEDGAYIPQYRFGTGGRWAPFMKRGPQRFQPTGATQVSRDAAWGQAYGVLEQHENPAALAVRFVGTF